MRSVDGMTVNDLWQIVKFLRDRIEKIEEEVYKSRAEGELYPQLLPEEFELSDLPSYWTPVNTPPPKAGCYLAIAGKDVGIGRFVDGSWYFLSHNPVELWQDIPDYIEDECKRG